MQEILNNRYTIVDDEEVLSKFNSFRDGIGDVLLYLYRKNNCYYLVMSPYDSLFLEEVMIKRTIWFFYFFSNLLLPKSSS